MNEPAMKILGYVVLLWALPIAVAAAQVVTHAQAPHAELLALDYEETLARAEDARDIRSRSVAASRLREGERKVSGLPGDLVVSAELGPRVAPRVAAQGRIGVAQSFALSNLGKARREVLHEQGRAFDAEGAALSFERRIAASRAFLEVRYAQQAVEVANNELRLAEDFARVTARGAELQELTRADAADAAAYAAEAKLMSLSAEGALADARFALTYVLAVADRIVDARGDTPTFQTPTPGQAAALHTQLERSPALVAILCQLQASDARKRELSANTGSQLALGLVADRTDPSAFALLGTVSVTLPWQRRSERERAELDASSQLLGGRLAEERARSHVELERLLHELEHQRDTLLHIEGTLLPAVEAGLVAREALFRSGEGDALEVIVARRSALAVRVRRERVRTDLLVVQARYGELARVIGGGT